MSGRPKRAARAQAESRLTTIIASVAPKKRTPKATPAKPRAASTPKKRQASATQVVMLTPVRINTPRTPTPIKSARSPQKRRSATPTLIVTPVIRLATPPRTPGRKMTSPSPKAKAHHHTQHRSTPRSPTTHHTSKPRRVVHRAGHIRGDELTYFQNRLLPANAKRRFAGVHVLNAVRSPQLGAQVSRYLQRKGAIEISARHIPYNIKGRLHVIGDDRGVLEQLFANRIKGTRGLGFLRFSLARHLIYPHSNGSSKKKAANQAHGGSPTKRSPSRKRRTAAAIPFENLLIERATGLSSQLGGVRVLNLISEPKARRSINRFVRDFGGKIVARPHHKGLPHRVRHPMLVVDLTPEHLARHYQSRVHNVQGIRKLAFLPADVIMRDNAHQFGRKR